MLTFFTTFGQWCTSLCCCLLLRERLRAAGAPAQQPRTHTPTLMTLAAGADGVVDAMEDLLGASGLFISGTTHAVLKLGAGLSTTHSWASLSCRLTMPHTCRIQTNAHHCVPAVPHRPLPPGPGVAPGQQQQQQQQQQLLSLPGQLDGGLPSPLVGQKRKASPAQTV